MKRHIGIKHAPILDQEDVGEDIAGKDPELLQDSIEVLKIYKLLQRMKKK